MSARLAKLVPQRSPRTVPGKAWVVAFGSAAALVFQISLLMHNLIVAP